MNRRGITLLEVIICIVILSVFVVGVSVFFSRTTPFYYQSQTRQTLNVDARRAFDLILLRLRRGKASTRKISNQTAAPPGSQIYFEVQEPLPSGALAYSIYQLGNTLYTIEYPTIGGVPSLPSILINNVASIQFTGNSIDPGDIKVALALEKSWDGASSDVASIQLNEEVHMAESP